MRTATTARHDILRGLSFIIIPLAFARPVKDPCRLVLRSCMEVFEASPIRKWRFGACGSSGTSELISVLCQQCRRGGVERLACNRSIRADLEHECGQADERSDRGAFIPRQ